jgi:2-oxoglutarate ferredoxin oxidoreductase subunit alpha
MAGYFTRGTGHNEYAGYSERPDDWEQNLERLHRKFETARQLVPAPVIDEHPNARIGLLGFGSNDAAVQEARARLAAQGIDSSYLRLRALPISSSVRDFIHHHDLTFVVETNFDGQLHTILRSEEPAYADKLISLRKCDGLSLSARFISEGVLANIK